MFGHKSVFGCSHMTSQGSASGRFQRAIRQGNLFRAELAAREMGGLQLGPATSAAFSPPSRIRASSGQRFAGTDSSSSSAGVDRLSESQLLLAALAELPLGNEEIEAVLKRAARRHGLA